MLRKFFLHTISSSKAIWGFWKEREAKTDNCITHSDIHKRILHARTVFFCQCAPSVRLAIPHSDLTDSLSVLSISLSRVHAISDCPFQFPTVIQSDWRLCVCVYVYAQKHSHICFTLWQNWFFCFSFRFIFIEGAAYMDLKYKWVLIVFRCFGMAGVKHVVVVACLFCFFARFN